MIPGLPLYVDGETVDLFRVKRRWVTYMLKSWGTRGHAWLTGRLPVIESIDKLLQNYGGCNVVAMHIAHYIKFSVGVLCKWL